MAQVTSPIILDSTGQQIHSDLQQIKNVLTTPSTAADITFDNTGTGMQADDVQDAITELKSNLTDNITEANSLTYVKQGNKRRISMNLSTFGNFKTLYNGLSATDKPTNTFTAVVLVMTVELKYVKEGYIKIGNNLLEAKKSNGFNSANAMDDIADGSYIMGAIEWYVA